MTATPLPTTSIDYDPVETTGAGRFRVQVGRYKERWYTDPLPGCDIAPASDWQGPSVSTVKKASGSDWSNTTIRRIAHALLEQPHRFDGLDADTIADQMRRINRDGLNAAGNRGTGVHTIAEHMLTGQTAMFIDPAAEPYRPALEAWFDKYQPRLILAEFACFNRELHGHGFGGTADALLQIDGRTYLVDWKSRGERHTVYAQEAAQLGGYALAEYVIGANDQHRRLLPKIDAGLIVSITPDGCRTYPIDLDKAADKFTDLHGWWVSRRSERDPIGKAWPTVTPQPQVPVEVDGFDSPQVAAPPPPSGVEQPAATDDETHGNAASSVAAPSRREQLRTRYRQLPTDQQQWFRNLDIHPNNLDQIESALNIAEARTQPAATFTDNDQHVTADAVTELVEQVAVSGHADVVNGWLKEATAMDACWNPRLSATPQRYEILRAALALAPIHTADPDNATVLLACALGDDQPGPVGAALGRLDLQQARSLTLMANAAAQVLAAPAA